MIRLEPITKPNFFVLGAAKSGTTFLYHTLKQHPDIFLCSIKEPGFWCKHVEYFDNPADYFALFNGVTDEKIIGECSHIYLSDPQAAPILRGLFPDAKFVVTLRNPVDRAYSLYLNMRDNGFEFSRSFEAALSVEERRFHSEKFKRKNSKFFWNYLYYRSGLYGEQIQRYFSLFDRSQFHIITLDRLQAEFETTMSELLHFLGLDSGFQFHIAPEYKNTGYGIRLFSIQRLRRILPREYRKYIKPLLDFNKTTYQPLGQETRKNLIEKYESDLKLLYKLTGINLIG